MLSRISNVLFEMLENLNQWVGALSQLGNAMLVAGAILLFLVLGAIAAHFGLIGDGHPFVTPLLDDSLYLRL